MKIQKGKDVHFVVLPAQFIRLLNWTKGTEVAVFPGPEPKTLLIKEIPTITPKNKDTSGEGKTTNKVKE